MVGRAPDGRRLAALLRTSGAGAAGPRSRPEHRRRRSSRRCSRPRRPGWRGTTRCTASRAAPADDAWNPPRLEYALSVGARLSANAGDEMTFSASEIDGPIDWSSFDVNAQASLTTAGDQGFTPIVEATIPAPVNFPGIPAPRFWEMEDARLAYGLLPVGPTDLAQLMMIEYASSYGNDWFVVPLTLPVGSVTRVDSLVVTDTFGVRSLIRPIGDPAIPAPHFSLWQSSLRNPASFSAATSRHEPLLPAADAAAAPSTAVRSKTCCSCATRWPTWPGRSSGPSRARSSSRRNATRRPTPCPSNRPSIRRAPACRAICCRRRCRRTGSRCCRCRFRIRCISEHGRADPVAPQARRGPAARRVQKVHTATGEVLRSLGNQLLYDEEVPREGARITRQRRMARWTDGSTWLWTSFRNQAGQGEGSSQLKFDQVIEPGDRS